MKRFGPWILLIAAMLLLAGCKEETAKTNIEMGDEALGNLDYAAAAGYYAAAISAEEDAQVAYRGLGMANLGLTKYKEAIEAFTNALQESSGRVRKIEYDISYYLAVAQVKNGDYEDAYRTYTAILAMNEKDGNACYLRGKVSLYMEDKLSAMDDFDRAIVLDPTNYDLYIAICKDLTDAGYEENGKSYVQRARNTEYKKSEYQKGVLDYYVGEYEDARDAFETFRAKKNQKDTKDLILYLGKTYEALGDRNYAASLYVGYLNEHPEETEIFERLGLLRLELEDYEGALAAFQAGLATKRPEYEQSLRFNEIVAYEFLLDFKKAAVLMQEYLKAYPEDEVAQREYEFLKTR